jgi:acyl-CoA synthetase (AMP-forming)/AMP-acid ligase II
MKKTILAALAAGAALCAVSTSASAREFADIYTECGLGSMIAPNNGAVAAVTNVTWDLGTTAVSSNISSPESCKGGQPKKAAFIHEAYPQLAQDLARGNGKHLATLMTLSGCSAQAQPALVVAVRADLAALTARAGYAQQTRFEQARQLFEAMNERSASLGATGGCSIDA